MPPIEKTPDGDGNDRETGARKFPAAPGESDRDKEGLEAAENRGSGLSEPLSETPEKTRKSDGRNPSSRFAEAASGKGAPPERGDVPDRRMNPKK